MKRSKPKAYRRLDKAERAAIERGLDKRKSCRQMARELGRSPSTVADEVARNRTVSRGPNKGGRADLCQDFGHGSLRIYAAMGSSPGLGFVRSKNSSMAFAGIL